MFEKLVEGSCRYPYSRRSCRIHGAFILVENKKNKEGKGGEMAETIREIVIKAAEEFGDGDAVRYKTGKKRNCIKILCRIEKRQ